MGLFDRFRASPRTTPDHEQPFECDACELTFKRRRVNCPACGNSRVRRRT